MEESKASIWFGFKSWEGPPGVEDVVGWIEVRNDVRDDR